MCQGFVLRFFLFLAFIFTPPVWAENSPSIMMCAYDMGDTNIIKRVAAALDEENKNYVILAMGRAKTVFKDHPKAVHLTSDSIADRGKPLSKLEVNSLVKKYNPRVIFSGMSYVGQAQILNAFKGARRYAVYDNFDDPSHKDFIAPFMAKIKTVTAFLVPADFLKKPMKVLSQGRGEVITVGQPALEDWITVFQSTNKEALMQKLNIKPNQKVIIFAGGMDKTYQPYFKIFVDAVKQEKNWIVFVTYHPKSSGDVERSVVQESGATNIVVSNAVPTNQLATIANALVTHKSSVLQQAFPAGVRQCVYVAGPDYDNFLIKEKIAPRFSQVAKLKTYLQRMTDKPDENSLRHNQSVAQRLGVPMNATQKILKYLKK